MLERIKTALILLVIVGVCLFALQTPILMLMLLAVGGFFAALEWAHLIPNYHLLAKNTSIKLFVVLSLVLSAAGIFVSTLSHVLWIAALILWLAASYWVRRYPKGTTQWFNVGLFPVGMVLISATISAMFYLWLQSPWWLLYGMLLVWCADTGAYFTGRAFGKHSLAPNVSPKKTYEGLVGGIALGALIVVLVGLYQLKLKDEALWVFIGLSVAGVGISVLGDLFESMIKRKAGVKDSGDILPGHGGVLDRIDSLMATLPLFALGFKFFGGF